MTDLDRVSLDRILPAASGSADWDDVLRRSGARHGGRRRRLVVLAVVALVAVATASAFGVRAFVLDKGIVGLPPVGATPSTPENGVLEMYYWVSGMGHATRLSELGVRGRAADPARGGRADERSRAASSSNASRARESSSCDPRSSRTGRVRTTPSLHARAARPLAAAHSGPPTIQRYCQGVTELVHTSGGRAI